MFWARVRTSGIHGTTFETETGPINVYDVGGERSERTKWIHKFGNVNVLVFVVDIVGYDRTLYEDEGATDMLESLTLFSSISNSKWFTKSPIILLFTKSDKFPEHLRNFSLADVFPDFLDGFDVEAAESFITDKFVALVPQAKKPVCVGYTSIAEDLASSGRVVARGTEYFEKLASGDGDDNERASFAQKHASYFVMDEDGVPVYHRCKLSTPLKLPSTSYKATKFLNG